MDDKVLITQKVVRDNNGFGAIIPLTDSLIPGNYFLRGYTRPMIDLPPDYLFIKPIVVDNATDRTDALTAYDGEILSEEQEYELSFFPKGGNFVLETPQRIVFVAKDRYGLPVSAEGVVINQRQDTIASVKSDYNDYGEFLLFANHTDSYVFTTNKGQTFTIPNATNNPTLRVMTHSGQYRYNVTGLSSDAQLSISQGSSEVLSVKVTAERPWGTINVSQLREGVICFRLCNTNGKLLSERLVFMTSDRRPDVRLVIDGDSLRIESRDRAVGDFVLRITHKNMESNMLLRKNIRSELLLCSELEEPLIHPEGAMKRPEYIDRLLIASTYRRINPTPAEPELNETVKGKVTGARTKGILFYGQSLDSLYQIDLDEQGQFAIDLPDFAGNSEFYIQPIQKSNKPIAATVEIEEESLPKVINRYKVLSLLNLEFTEPTSQKGIQKMIQAVPISSHYVNLSGLKTLRLQEVKVQGRSTKPVVETKEHYKALKLTGDDVFKYSNFNIASAVNRLINVSVKEVDGVMGAINTRTLGALGEACSMKFLVDGVFREPQEALSLAPAEVKSIEKLNVTESSIYGSRGFCGIIKIETYGPNDIRGNNNTTVEASGLSFIKTGHSPQKVNTFNKRFISFDSIEKEIVIPLPKKTDNQTVHLEGLTNSGEIIDIEVSF